MSESRVRTFAKRFPEWIYPDISACLRGNAAVGSIILSCCAIDYLSRFYSGDPSYSMAKAKYTTDAQMHFGLAFPHYTHFTSPIRRYPDMMVHRLLEHYLKKGKSVSPVEYESSCKHSSEMEKRAADAERASIKFKQVEYIQSVEDQKFKGIVSGVTEYGVFVEMIENKCEGMVRISTLKDDYYEYKNTVLCIRH